jgi:hypothetical protein
MNSISFKKFYFAVLFSLFVIIVFITNWHDKIFSFSQPLAFGKVLLLTMLIGFTAFTFAISFKENFFKSLKKVIAYRWGMQIGLDLFIGQILFLFIIYFFTGSILSVILWIGPFIVFGNLATMLYFFIHYDAIVAIFL